jgi:hypothetical protein
MFMGKTMARLKTINLTHLIVLGAFLCTMAPVPLALAYEEYNRFSGGGLKGTVTMKGPPIPPKRFNLVLNPDPYFCGRISDGKGWRLAPMTPVGSNHALQGAIVYLRDIEKGKPVSVSRRFMKIQNCVFIPYIEVMQTGETLHVENWDPVQHKLEVFLTSSEGALQIFGSDLKPHLDNRKSDYLSEGKTGTPQPGLQQFFRIDQPGIFFFRCHFHEYMESWSVVVPHPYYAMTNESGEFVISDIPPGSYTLMVWHPLSTVEIPIHIDAHDELTLDVELPPTLNSTHQEDPSNNNPFGIDLLGDVHIVPTVELQKWEPGSESTIGGGS